MITAAQEVRVGPVHVDTGDDYLDIAAAAGLLILLAATVIAVKRWGKK